MNVVLVNCIGSRSFHPFEIRAVAPPLGILYIAAVLRNEGVEVSIIDQPAEGSSDHTLIKRIISMNPDIVGFTILSTNCFNSAEAAKKIKESSPEIATIFGGPHATINAERILKKYSCIDYVMRGEGEYATLAFVNSIEKDGDLNEIDGLCFRKNGRMIIKESNVIEDLDTIPFVPYDMIEGNQYGNICGMHVDRVATILTSRGCPYSCTFCAVSSLSKGKCRFRSPENVINEIENLISRGFRNIVINDDNFTLNQRRVVKFCELIRNRGLQFNWLCEGRVDDADLDTYRKMAKAGCKLIYFGIENANEKILEYYNKRINPRQSKMAVEKARKAGIDIIIGTFILGAPNESLTDIGNTIKFASGLEIDFPQFNILSVRAGTKLWANFVKDGYIDEEEDWDGQIFVSDIHPNCVPKNLIQKKINEAYRSFTRRPSWILKETSRLFKSSFRRDILWHNLDRIDQVIQEIKV